MTPASRVTLVRAALAAGVAALAVVSGNAALVVALASVALALDLVDGWVARRTGTATPFGARFDGEVDAFLILALSVYVAPEYGWWVLAIGAARYVFLAGEWLLPWMRAPLPRRRWRVVVAATQGVVLTIAAAGILPRAAHPGAAGGGARPARGLDVRVRVVAVAPAAARASPQGHRRDGHDGGAAARVGRPRRAEPPGPPHPRRVRAAPARAPRRRRRRRPAARRPAPGAGRGRGSGTERARAREGARHRVLHGVRPAVQARRRLELPGDRHRDAARRDRRERRPRRRRAPPCSSSRCSPSRSWRCCA